MKFVSSKRKTQRSMASFGEYHRRNVFTFKENFEKSKLLPTFVLFQNIATYICQFHISANQSHKIFIIMNIIKVMTMMMIIIIIINNLRKPTLIETLSSSSDS